MRLINTKTLQMETFDLDRHPYAILSRRWGDDEATFQQYQQFQDDQDTSKVGGFRKIQGLCDQAKRDGIKWVWIDTCCINSEWLLCAKTEFLTSSLYWLLLA